MLLAAAAAILLGAILLIFGLRGRRTDDHPLCRKCRFDLVGLPDLMNRARQQAPDVPAAADAAPARCPECGTEISGPRATRIGHRRRLRSVVILACVCLIAGLALSGAAGWASATQFNWNTIKPVWWLKSESGSPNTPTAVAALSELTGRVKAGRLKTGDAAHLIARGLACQADTARAWIPEWGDFIQTAWGRGLLSEEQRLAYVRNAAQPRVVVRSRTIRGERCALQLHVSRARAGRRIALFLQPRLVSAEIAGRALALPEWGGYMGLSAGNSGALGNSITIDAEPGEHVLRTEWAYRAVETPGASVPATPEWKVVVETPITVLPEGAELLRLVKDESLRPAVRAAIRADPLSVRPGGDGKVFLSSLLVFTNPPVDLAFRVVLRSGGREWPGGTVVVKSGFSGQHAVGFGAEVDDSFDARSMDVILRPSLNAATGTTDIFDVWDGEIVIENVPIDWPKPDAPAPGGGGP